MQFNIILRTIIEYIHKKFRFMHTHTFCKYRKKLLASPRVHLVEYAVIMCRNKAAKMLLRAGCACGEFSLINRVSTGISSSGNIHGFQRFISPEIHKLMIELDLHKNKVRPLQQLCRKSILNHLCPRAVKKITELPLPPMIIRYLAFQV